MIVTQTELSFDDVTAWFNSKLICVLGESERATMDERGDLRDVAFISSVRVALAASWPRP